MPIKLPHPRSVLMVLATFSCAVLAYGYAQRDDGPSTDGIERAQTQLLAGLFEDEGPASVCQAQQAEFQSLLGDVPASAPVKGAICDLEMLKTLRLVLEEAEADFAAGREDVAFSKARAVVGYNQAVLGQRTLLAVSVSGARATEAIALMQNMAARSLDSGLRAQWRREVEVLGQGQLEAAELGPAIVTGEARAYVSVDEAGSVAYGLPQAVADKMTKAYAGLLRDLEHGGGLLPTCLERVPEVAACTLILRADSQQRALSADLGLLAKMLKPRQ